MNSTAVVPVHTSSPPPLRAVDHLARNPVLYWILGGVTLFALQVLATGTGMTYAALTFGFVVATGITVTLLGGVATLPGVCVLLLALQHVLIAQFVKLIVGNPADAPLAQPTQTMGMYLVGMCSLMGGAALVRQWRLYSRLRPLFRAEELLSEAPTRLLVMGLVATVLATVRQLVIMGFGLAEDGEVVSGGLLGPLKTMELLTPFSVSLTTAYVLQASRNQRSVSLANALALLPPFLLGILGAGRAATAMSLTVYVCTCLAFGYRFRLKHYAALGIGAYVLQMILFPYALAARHIVRTPNLADNIQLATNLLTDVVLNPSKYQLSSEERLNKLPLERRERLYYGEPEPTLDRYAVLISVDAIVDATLSDGTTGMETIQPGFEMLLPRFLNPNKPVYATSNMLAHRATGLVNDQDFTTGITLGLFADAFSSFGWSGVVIIPFLVLISLVLVYQKLTGCTLHQNPYALAFVFSLPWSFSENTIAVAILSIVQGGMIIFVAFTLIRLFTVLLSPQYGAWGSGRGTD